MYTTKVDLFRLADTLSLTLTIDKSNRMCRTLSGERDIQLEVGERLWLKFNQRVVASGVYGSPPLAWALIHLSKNLRICVVQEDDKHHDTLFVLDNSKLPDPEKFRLPSWGRAKLYAMLGPAIKRVYFRYADDAWGLRNDGPALIREYNSLRASNEGSISAWAKAELKYPEEGVV